ncbi:hypothetical protein [Microbulbifer sp. TYP-18]|uniref:hypothetical protein n=1 Tax=Microbulbifer sp. TYP-18 TaxID=3230024 RepID=UPI0034C6C858
MKPIRLNLDTASISAIVVAASRRASYLFPGLNVTVVRACDMDWWKGVCKAIRERCRRSYQLWGHCENPFPVGDLKRWEWVDETQAIMRERLSLVLRDTSWAEEDAICDLGGAKRGEVIPFPAPQRQRQPQQEAVKRKINWECEDIHV